MLTIHKHDQYGPGSRAERPIPSSALRGGGGTPLCIGKREVGTYIYSRTYTVHGTLGDFLKSLRLLM
jgi:hypothetical protein